MTLICAFMTVPLYLRIFSAYRRSLFIQFFHIIRFLDRRRIVFELNLPTLLLSVGNVFSVGVSVAVPVQSLCPNRRPCPDFDRENLGQGP